MIELNLEDSHVALGHALSGEFTWQPKDVDKEPKSGRVSLVWFTEGRGSRDYKTVVSQEIEGDRLIKYQQRPFEFQLNIPYDAPLIYNGHLFRLIWKVEVSIAFPGIFRPRETETHTIKVLPH